MKKLRLLLTEHCNQKCPGCCNDDWNLSILPIEYDYSEYDIIMLTGGEPMQYPINVINAASIIRNLNPTAKIYLYTAKVNKLYHVLSVLNYLDGMTVTVHTSRDIIPFMTLNSFLLKTKRRFDLRLNIFKGISVPGNLSLWDVKKNIEWIKNCPLPEGEVFKKINPKFTL